MGLFSHPVTPNLARVLAQAAGSAFVESSTFYVVCRYDSTHSGGDPFNVQKPVATLEEAEALAESLGAEYEVFGPFQNTFGGFNAPLPNATVEKFLVVPQGGLEPEEPFWIPGTEFDALFYSIQAVEKFVLPYYEQEYGPDFAQQVLTQFYHAPLALMGHLPWSEYVDDVGPSGGGYWRREGDADPASDAQPPVKPRYVPVFFHRDAGGRVQRQPMYPPKPAEV